MKSIGRILTSIRASVCILSGVLAIGCSSGPPPPTMQTARSGVDPRAALKHVQNSDMPDFFKQKREKVLQDRINNGG